MPNKKQELVIRAIIAEIDDAKKTDKQFLIYTLPTSVFDHLAVDQFIASLRALGYYVTYFSKPDEDLLLQSPWNLYICWTEAAMQDATSRGYRFG